MQEYEDPKWMRPCGTCVLMISIYFLSSLFFVFVSFLIARVTIESDPIDLHGGRGIGAFFISVFIGVFVLGPLTTIGCAMYMAYKSRKSSKEKRKNDSFFA